ncbi:MAG: hypothetical protein RIQ53_1317 [Pseudomonadota bacterium]
MNNASAPAPEDLRVFDEVARRSSFIAAAQALGASPAYVSKRIKLLEQQLGTQLLHRSTRRVALTEDGERVHRWALRILDDFEQLRQALGGTPQQAVGHLRVVSSFGFGRRQVAPALAALSRAQPQLQLRLELCDRLVDVAGEGHDLDLRVGDEIAPQLIASRLARNHRVLCAAPSWVAAHGRPATPQALQMLDCLVIKERDHPVGLWRLQQGARAWTVKVAGPLSSNHGEVALQWALDGHGIVLRSLWEVAPLLADGRLVQLLPDCIQPADIWAVYPTRLERSAKLRVAVDFLADWFAARGADQGRWG